MSIVGEFHEERMQAAEAKWSEQIQALERENADLRRRVECLLTYQATLESLLKSRVQVEADYVPQHEYGEDR